MQSQSGGNEDTLTWKRAGWWVFLNRLSAPVKDCHNQILCPFRIVSLTRKAVKKVLIITNVFPACAIPTSNKRFRSFHRYFPQYGWLPVFLSLSCLCVSENNDCEEYLFLGLEDDEPTCREKIKDWKNKGGTIVVAAAPSSPSRFKRLSCSPLNSEQELATTHHEIYCPIPEKKNLLTDFKSKVWAFISQFSPCENQWEERGVMVGSILVEEFGIDVVMSSSPPLSNMFIGSKLERRFRVPWLVDTRDALLRHLAWYARHPLRRLYLYSRLGAVKKAAASVYVTPGEAKWDGRFTGKRKFVVENGYLEDEVQDAISNPIKAPYFTIRYAGRIYSCHPIELFLEAIKCFVLKNEIAASQFRFEYVGNQHIRIQQLVEKFDVSDFCNVSPPVDRHTALAFSAGANVLLHMTHKQPKGSVAFEIPGSKLYENIALMLPILVVGEHDNYVKTVTDNSVRAIWCNTLNDTVNNLEILYKEYLDNGEIKIDSSVLPEIEKYSRRHRARNYVELLNEIVNANEINHNN